MKRFQHGDRVCFLGDSITAQNRYVALIADHYKTCFPEESIRIFNCGISGGTAALMRKYFEEDVRPHDPTHIFIMLGVNDARCHLLSTMERSASRHTALRQFYEDYKTNLTALLNTAVSTGADVTLMTPPPYDEYTGTNAHPGGFALIAGFAEFVRALCAETGCRMIDIHTFLTEQLQSDVLYDSDHVHPNDMGHYLLAKRILQEQGLDIGAFRPMPAYLTQWRDAVAAYRGLYAVEYMVIANDSMTPHQKIGFIQDYLDRQAYNDPTRDEGTNAFFKRVGENYLQNKLRQTELFAQIDTLFDSMRANELP